MLQHPPGVRRTLWASQWLQPSAYKAFILSSNMCIVCSKHRNCGSAILYAYDMETKQASICSKLNARKQHFSFPTIPLFSPPHLLSFFVFDICAFFLPHLTFSFAFHSLSSVYAFFISRSPCIQNVFGIPQLSHSTMNWTSRVRLPACENIFVCTSTSERALGPNQPPILWVLAVLSPKEKRPGIWR
jgi:hypothetical protein